MGFIAKQPNGKYCIFDDINDQPKKWNITKEEYITSCVIKARKDALKRLSKSHDFKEVYENFMEDEHMTREQFDIFLKEVGCNSNYTSLLESCIN